ncbi:Arc family DNA-binding protein [Brucella sp. BE17]|uniref:Arc family DNA-binding protein n=1 Tax=Brucella sp. BE17 TaxID=3142977 RepID=UPI0031BB4BFC
MARPTYPSDQVDKTMVRFPKGMMSHIKELAALNKRSMNAEIIALLEEALEDRLVNNLGIFRKRDATLKALRLGRTLMVELQKLKEEADKEYFDDENPSDK